MPETGNSALPTLEMPRSKLTASILSAYDLPDSSGTNGSAIQPSHVSMTILQKKVRTGPPSARHRDSNSFKFISERTQNQDSSCKFWVAFFK